MYGSWVRGRRRNKWPAGQKRREGKERKPDVEDKQGLHLRQVGKNKPKWSTVGKKVYSRKERAGRTGQKTVQGGNK